MNSYEGLEETDWVTFAEVYLDRCREESQSENLADVQVYTKLVGLDFRLGTIASLQLYRCLRYTTRFDLIKV